MMTDTTVTLAACSARPGRHFNRPVAEAMYENIERVGLPAVERGRPGPGEGRPARAEAAERAWRPSSAPLAGPVATNG